MLLLGRKRKLRHFAKAETKTLQELKSTHTEAQALFHAYEALIIAGLDKQLGEGAVWNDLTKPQQVLMALSHLTSQVNNGGVWQFLFNKREFSVAAGESLAETLRLSSLLTKYQDVLREFAAMNGDGRWQTLTHKLLEAGPTSPEAWKLFVEGEEAIPSAEEFNKLFFEPKTRTRMYSAFNRYIEQNLDKLLKVESSQGTPTQADGLPDPASQVPVKKKDAIPHFIRYLEAQYGMVPEEVGIYYTGRVTIESEPSQLFLMRYKLSNGFESLGITGKFTLHLPELTFAEVKKMHQQYHKQKLVNIFYGAYLVNKTLAENPSAGEMEPGLWEKFLSRVQGQTGGQIPVNVKFQEYFKMKDFERVIYTGDLRYYRKDAEAPKNPQKVSTDKKDGFAGETDRRFFADPNATGFGGRASRDEPVEGTYCLYTLVGRKFKLLKDNPWGN